MCSDFNPINSVSQILLSSSVGYAMTYSGDVVDPVHGALFCGLSSLISQLASPVLNKTLNAKDANLLSQWIGWGLHAFYVVEIPRDVLKSQQIFLTFENCAPMILTSTLIVSTITRLKGAITSCKAPSHRITSDPFLDTPLRS